MATTKTKKKVKVVTENVTTVQRSILSKALSMVSKAINPNPPLPLLTNVLVECNNNESSIAGTNLEIAVRYNFHTSGLPFRTCVPAKTFQGLVDTMNSDEIDIRVDTMEQSMIVMTPNSSSSLKCLNPEDFPFIPQLEDAQISMSVITFKQMVQRVAFASSNRDEGSILEGVLFAAEYDKKYEEKKFVMFAADRARCSYEETTDAIVQGESFRAIIKGITLETIAKILPDEGILDIEVRDTKILFQCEGVNITSQVLSGDFPDYHVLYNTVKERKTTVKFPTLELLRACKQLKVFAQTTGTSQMEIQDMFIRYSTVKQETGDTDVTMFAEKDGEDVTIVFNVFFLHELLEVTKTQNILLLFNTNRKPILLKMEGVDNFYHIIMPFSPGSA